MLILIFLDVALIQGYSGAVGRHDHGGVFAARDGVVEADVVTVHEPETGIRCGDVHVAHGDGGRDTTREHAAFHTAHVAVFDDRIVDLVGSVGVAQDSDAPVRDALESTAANCNQL